MSKPPDMRPPPVQPPPLLYGPDDLTEGYYQLEVLERQARLQALLQNGEPVALWYRALTLYWRGMYGEWDFTDVTEDMSRLTIFGLQAQLLGLGLSSAKAALDMLLAGYYSVAFASIRHMLETFVQYLYVAVEPDAAKLWYMHNDNADIPARTPSCKRMVDTVKARSEFPPAEFMERVYESWALMSKGAHPTGEGIVQTVGDNEGRRFVLGATYDQAFYLTGFDHGLFAITKLLTALVGLRGQNGEWEFELHSLQDDISRWRKTVASGLGIPDSRTFDQDSVVQEAGGASSRECGEIH